MFKITKMLLTHNRLCLEMAGSVFLDALQGYFFCYTKFYCILRMHFKNNLQGYPKAI